MNARRQSALQLSKVVSGDQTTKQEKTNILEINTLQSVGVTLVCDSEYIPWVLESAQCFD